jgi:hypothetical protein
VFNLSNLDHPSARAEKEAQANPTASVREIAKKAGACPAMRWP